MSASSGITVDAWLTELSSLTKQNAEGWTTDEMALQLGRSTAWVRRMVAKSIASGGMVCAGRRSITRIDGGSAATPVYRVVAKGPRTAAKRGPQ